MKRLALLLGTFALAAAFHSRAHAQSPTTTQAIQNPVEVEREGKQLDNAQEIYGTLEDCEGGDQTKGWGAEYKFAMDFSTTVPVWEAWLGVGSTDCSQVTSRTVSGSTTAKPACKLLAADTRNTARPRITTYAKDMFSRDWPAGDHATQCDKASRQLYTVYLLPLPQETSLGSNTASMVGMYGLYSTRTVTFTVYTNPPETPTDVKGEPGEVRVGVTFDVIAGAQPKTRYRAYFDWGTGGPGECGSGVLEGKTGSEPDEEEPDEEEPDEEEPGEEPAIDAGAEMDGAAETDAETEMDAAADAGVDAAADAGTDAAADASASTTGTDSGVRPPPSGTPNVEAVTVKSGKAYLDDLDSRGIQIGDMVAVSVVTVDPANNESNLSVPICVPRKLTRSFTDNCKDDPGCRDGFTTCSLSPGQRTGGLLGVGSLMALAAALVLRRRRHV